MHITSTHNGAVGIITIDRPHRFNSLDVCTAQDFRRAALRDARDDRVRVVVIRGIPGVFCSGADLKYIRDGGDPTDLRYLKTEDQPPVTGLQPPFGRAFKQILEYIHSTISEIRRAPKPFIAAVDGVAAAGGFGIAMACDLVVASPHASFEWAYSKTGLTGAESTTFLLPRLVGLRRALGLMLLGPRLSAQEALSQGLITAVFEDRFDDRTMALAEQLAAGPRHAFAVAKELLNQAAGMDQLDAHLDREIEELSRAANGAEVGEGLAAFCEKRQARYA
jgi:2-(1,2-epoxy-1,2-dihydrophenyl)acetyl-CoA isomerase